MTAGAQDDGSQDPGTDFALARPHAERTGGDEGPADGRRPASADGDYELSEPVAAGSGAVPEAAAPAGRPTPLHDPDPYSTPPYGEPGPWAPAPPVQHPAAPAATPAHGTSTAPAPHPTAAHPTSAPQAPAPHPTAPHPMAPPPAPAAPPTVPPHGVVPNAPASPVAPASTPGPAPVPAGPEGAPVSEGVAPGAPAPHDAAPPADPWHRYDPWAAAGASPQAAPGVHAPLQQTGAAVDTEQQRRRKRRRAAVAFVLAVATVSGGVGGLVGAYLERNGGVGTTVELPQAGEEPAGRAPDSVAGIAARALPSVVTLHVTGSEEQGTGTGFVLDTRGHILTNNHVVQPAGTGGEITVVFNGGQTAKAKVVGRDSGYDLAVVQVSGVNGLKPMPLGNSDNVRVGDPVVAIGAPFDLAGTVTSGIISAKERPITAGGEKGDGSDVSYVDALQTDAPINPGNSGGPLLDSRGRVVGINSAIRSADSAGDAEGGGQAGSIGLGFAIPINQGRRVAEELINTGHATHPVIGITLDMDYTGDGARVGAQGDGGGPSVTPGGPGAKAGIRPGDVITAVDGQIVHSGEELIVKTRAHRPGDRLELTVERRGHEEKVSLVLGSAGGD
ncbi:trypsin-like peptidase domain-containing protein [Streptomyces sp. NPDC028635]|uniref:S1C family serine protease n=1 Tax=Streptomyces sp. NPDC028635 TaxID=3154800 RepID=UPI003404BFF2